MTPAFAPVAKMVTIATSFLGGLGVALAGAVDTSSSGTNWFDLITTGGVVGVVGGGVGVLVVRLTNLFVRGATDRQASDLDALREERKVSAERQAEILRLTGLLLEHRIDPEVEE